MARIRTIKPEFFRHEGLQDIETEHPELRPMLVFIGLWGHCDRQGVFPWEPRQLALDILPFVWQERLGVELERCLELLEKAGFVQRFEANGKVWGWVPGFSEHQRISGKEAESAPRYPEPPETENGNPGETPGKHQGSTGEVSGKHQGAQELGTRNWELGTRNLSVCYPSSAASALPARGTEAPPQPQHTHTPPNGRTFNPHEREPTPNEIRTHAAMVGYPQIDAEGFLEHYRAVGWMRGATPITDWRPLVARWREVDRTRQGNPARASPGSNGRRDRKPSGKGLAAAMEELTELERQVEARDGLERGKGADGTDLRALPGKRRPG